MSRRRVFTDDISTTALADELDAIAEDVSPSDGDVLCEAARRLRLLAPHEFPDIEDSP